jgi:hypothetical protein
MLGMQCI